MLTVLRETPALARSRSVTRYFHPVLPAKQLGKAPVRVTVDQTSYVLWRDRVGRAAAVEDVCPHRLARLSRGVVRSDGRIACAYHGWHFDALGAGVAPSFPNKKCSVLAKRVVERAGYLWLADADVPVENMPSVVEPDAEPAGMIVTRFHTPLQVALDNFSENEHLPWVHSIFGWNEQSAHQVELQCELLDDRSVVRYRGPQRPHPLLPLFGVSPGDTFCNEWETRFDPVCTRYKLSWFDKNTGAPRPFAALFHVYLVPETPRSTLCHTLVFTQVRLRVPRPLRALIRGAVRFLGDREISSDAAFVSSVLPDAGIELEGMHPSPWDKPVVHNRKLVERLYWGDSSS